jgi:hypothetical protein
MQNKRISLVSSFLQSMCPKKGNGDLLNSYGASIVLDVRKVVSVFQGKRCSAAPHALDYQIIVYPESHSSIRLMITSVM